MVKNRSGEKGRSLAMKRPRLGRLGRGILWRFAFFALLSLAIMVGIILYAAWRVVQDARMHQESMALWTARSLDSWLQELDYTLSALSPDLLDAAPDETREQLGQVLQGSRSIRRITLVDAREEHRGKEILSLDYRGVYSGSNYVSERWFRMALNDGRYVAPLVKVIPMAVVAHSLCIDGTPVGVVAVQVEMDWAYELLRRARTERGTYAYVVDNVGQPLLHEDTRFTNPQRIRTDIAGILSVVQDRPFPLYYTGLNWQNEPVIGAFWKMERAGWTVIAEQPLAALLREFFPLLLGAGAVLLLSAAAAVVAALYISRRVAVPVSLLSEGARRIGAGDLEHRILLRTRNELADLAEEFNRMTESLQEARRRQEAWGRELEERVRERTAELGQALQQLQQEAAARENLLRTIREMSSPVIPVMEGILVMPIVGTLDSERAQRVMEDLLAGVERGRARVVILDITGLAMVDTAVAHALIEAARAAQLLGARPILVGISPAVAETLVHLGVDLGELRTAATLQEGLQIGLGLLRRKIVPL